ncbi:INO80 complex subunit E [Dendroctonus ponderosae]|uniref:INO80 complex subunit E N-terminal domain-containing protein n=1 Tax=Dendroctonus ponderosae TaxID=77166 RepID=J3JYV6_DENPD|nr:INO80 complex subunit E [Dendroctonus ponderosae]AEE63394.1 unknown [Dendroctonus ponderosae]
MLDGWYCRSIANEAAQAEEVEHAMEESKFKKEYKALKNRFQHLVYENESFQVALRKSQKRLLQVTRDRSFLLDRLLIHEKLDHSTSESEETESSDEEPSTVKIEPSKKRKPDLPHNSGITQHINSGKSIPAAKKKRPASSRLSIKQVHHAVQLQVPTTTVLSDGHMTPEEVERHLQSQSFLDLVPERAPPTVPTEMFSNEPSLDSESNDMIGDLEMSPTNIEEEISIDYLPE